MAVDTPAVIPVQQFYDALTTGGVRLQHQYQMVFNVVQPDGINDLLKQFTIWAEGTELPSRTQNYVNLHYLAYEFQQATNMTMSTDFTTNIRCDAMTQIRDALLAWQGTVTDPHIRGGAAGGGMKRASPNECYIHLYDETMKTAIATYRLVGITPGEIGTMTLSNENASIATFSATFKYQFWEYVLSPTGGALATA